jgi:hypothetical protein
LFEFLGVVPAPGISEKCFSTERERFGPGDYKIWYTAKISADSVGRGWSVPAGMIAPHLMTAINEMAGKLSYLPVDGDWGTTAPPADLRIPVTGRRNHADREEGSSWEAELGAGGTADSVIPALSASVGQPAERAPRNLQDLAQPAGTYTGAAVLERARSAWLADQLRTGLAAVGGGRQGAVGTAQRRDFCRGRCARQQSLPGRILAGGPGLDHGD